MSDSVELARMLLELRDEHPKLRGPLTRAAQLLVSGQRPPSGSDPVCEKCGTPLDQRLRGRPKKWCSESCRNSTRDRK